MSELLTIVVEAQNAWDAELAAKAWAAAEPAIRLVKLTRVRPATPAPGNPPNAERWEVELAYVAVADQMDAGL